MAQRVGRGIALLFHDRGTRRCWVISSTPWPHFTPGKTQYPFYRRLGGPQGRSGRAENLVPTGIRSRKVQPVAQSLYRLSYSAHTTTTTTTTTTTKKVKWSRYRRGVAQRVGRGIALLFHDSGTRRAPPWWLAARPGRNLARERPDTHFTGGWVGPSVGLDWRKISSPPGFDPRPSSP